MAKINNISNNINLLNVSDSSISSETKEGKTDTHKLNKVNSEIEEVSLELSNDENTNDLYIKELSSSDGMTEYSNAYGLFLMEEVGIYCYEKEDIKSVESSSYYTYVELKSGNTLVFSYEDGKYVLKFVKVRSGDLLPFNEFTSPDEKKNAESFCGKINDYYLTIPQTNIGIYKELGIIDFKKYLAEVNNIMDALKACPDEILKTLQDFNFYGFVINSEKGKNGYANWDELFVIDIMAGYNQVEDILMTLTDSKRESIAAAIAELLDRNLANMYFDNPSGEGKFSVICDDMEDMLKEYEKELKKLTPGKQDEDLSNEELFEMAIRSYILREDKLREKASGLHYYLQGIFLHGYYGN